MELVDPLFVLVGGRHQLVVIAKKKLIVVIGQDLKLMHGLEHGECPLKFLVGHDTPQAAATHEVFVKRSTTKMNDRPSAMPLPNRET